jgi:hypothetical protein
VSSSLGGCRGLATASAPVWPSHGGAAGGWANNPPREKPFKLMGNLVAAIEVHFGPLSRRARRRRIGGAGRQRVVFSSSAVLSSVWPRRSRQTAHALLCALGAIIHSIHEMFVATTLRSAWRGDRIRRGERLESGPRSG